MPYYLGFTLAAGRALRPAAVPANYRDADVIARKRQELADEALALAPRVPTAGVVVAYCLLDRDGRVSDSIAEFAAGAPRSGRQLVAELVNCRRRNPQAIFVGFDIHICLRVACMEALWSADAGVVPPELHVGDDPRIVDPYLALVHSGDRRHVTVDDLLSHFAIGHPPERARSPRGAAEIARELCLAAQLFGPP